MNDVIYFEDNNYEVINDNGQKNTNPAASLNDLENLCANAAQCVESVVEQFSDEVPNDNSVNENTQKTPKQERVNQEAVNKAKGFLHNFMDYIKSIRFKKDINATAQRYRVSPKKLANNFFEIALGTIGDVLGVVFNTLGNAAHVLADVLASVAHGAINVVISVANALSRLVTLNYTASK